MRKLLLLLIGVALFAFPALAQRIVTGKVTDEKGNPVANVSVIVKGTTIGVATNTDGNFSITVPATGKSLIFSAVDMATVEIPIPSDNTLDVTMRSQDKMISEVVVIGYGTQKRKDVTAAIANVTGDRVKNLPVQSFDQALSGKMAGVNLVLPNGVLNNPPVLRIRGTNSISLSSYPLVVIDGVAVFTGDLSTNSAAANALGNLSPNDIEDISVLKDAAAAAIYGSRAANGVLLITTKRGRVGRPRVTYDAWVGKSKSFKMYDLLDAAQYIPLKNEGAVNAGLPPQMHWDTINGQLVNTNWYDYIYRTGLQHNHALSVSGGNEWNRYFLSASFTDQEGMIKNNDFERKQIRLNLDQKVNNWLKIGVNTSFTRSENAAPNTGSLPGQGFNTAGIARLAFVTAPNVSPFLANGQYNIMTPNDPVGRNNNNQQGRNKNLDRSGFYNPVLLLDLNKFTSVSDQFLGNMFGEVSLFRGLSFRGQYGLNYTTVEDKNFSNSLHGDGINTTATNDDGDASNTLAKLTNRNLQGYFTYNLSLNNRHNFNVVAGSEEQHNKVDRWGARRSGVADLFYNEFQGSYSINQNPVNNALTHNYLFSYYGRVNYDFKKKYFISGNVRRDGYSAYAEGKKWGNFGGGSVGWIISEEDFWDNMPSLVNMLKLRASYGLVGNTGVGNFDALSTFSGGNYGPFSTLFFSQAGNEDLTWEKVYKTDIGLGFGLLNDRISGEIGYYNSRFKDLIINVPTPPSMGIPGNSIPANVAEMYTRGIEFNVNARILEKKDLSWAVIFTLTTQKNEVTKLATGVNEIIGTTSGLERTNITRVGSSIGSIYGIRTTGVNPQTGYRIFLDSAGREVQYNHAFSPGQRFRYMDNTIAPSIDIARDGKILGNTLPKVYGGLSTTLGYKGIDLLLDFIYNYGNYIYNGSKAGLRDQRFWNNHVDVLRRWQKPGDNTDIPRIVYNDNVSNGSTMVISSNVEKGDFIKCRNIVLGYSLPPGIMKPIGLGSIRLYAGVQNAFTITDYTGADPEISSNGNSTTAPGVDRNTTFQARTFMFGLNVGF